MGYESEERLRILEGSFADMSRRLEVVEERLGLGQEVTPVRLAVAPPAAYVPPPIRFSAEAERPPVASSPPRFESPKIRPDAELQFGSVVLPRVGAGVLLMGIAYLVGLSIQRGWITPWHQFWGAVILCLGAIGLGFWQRREKFDFGQVLIGLGSCGLYLTFAGAHAFHDLFSGEVLVAVFAVLSFLNLGHGALTPSRTFVGIGLLGGLVAALLPLDRGHAEISLWLNVAISLTAFAVIARHKWPGMALGGWTVSGLALLPAFFAPGTAWENQILALYGVALAGAIAYGWSHDDWEFDPRALFIGVAVFLTGLVAFSRKSGLEGFWHEMLFGAAAVLAGQLMPRKAARESLTLGGIVTAFAFAPLDLPGLQSVWTYLGLAAACALASFRFWPKASTALGGLGLGLGLAMYGSHFSIVQPALPLGVETGILCLSLAVLTALTLSLARRLGQRQGSTFAGLLLASPLVSRLMVVLVGGPGGAFTPGEAILLALIGFSGAGAVIALRQRWPLLSAFAWMGFAASGMVYVGLAIEQELSLGKDLAFLAGIAMAAVLSSCAAGKTSDRESGGALAAFVGWPVFSRIVYLLATLPSVGLSGTGAITLAWTIYAVALMASGFLLDLRAMRIASFAVFGVTVGKVLLVDLADLDPAVRVVLLLLLGAAMIGGGYAYIRRSKTFGAGKEASPNPYGTPPARPTLQ